MNDMLLSQEQAQIPVICVKRRRRKRVRRTGCLLRIHRQSNKPPLLSILLENVQTLENKMGDLRGRLNPQRDIQNCNILCITELWLNDDIINILVIRCIGRIEQRRLVRQGGTGYVQLKSEVYIHLSQIHLYSVFHNSRHLILVKNPCLWSDRITTLF